MTSDDPSTPLHPPRLTPLRSGRAERYKNDRRERRKLTGMEYRSREWGVLKFSKNLHLLHLLHPSKLSEGRSSFGRRCTFEKSFLHRFCTASAPSAPSALFSALWAGFWRRVGCGLLRFVIMMSMPGSLDCRARGEGYEEVGPVFFRGPQRDHRHASREERAESR